MLEYKIEYLIERETWYRDKANTELLWYKTFILSKNRCQNKYQYNISSMLTYYNYTNWHHWGSGGLMGDLANVHGIGLPENIRQYANYY